MRRGALLVMTIAASACAPATPRLQDAPSVALYPTPLYATQSRRALPITTACLDTTALAQHATIDARGPALIAAAGLLPAAPGATCDFTLAFAAAPPSLSPGPSSAWDATSALAGGDERYIVLASARDNPAAASAELYAESERGALHALTTALSLVDAQRRVRAAVIVDAPPIATRGLVEGYYGKPFSRAQRLCVVGEMERLRQNLYLYGPKDDPYAHQRWADPYPADVAGDLRAAAAAARARLVDFVWSVSPGLMENASADGKSISFASAADFQRLTSKIDSVRALGIDRFALFLDDTAAALAYPEDIAMFGSAVAAHADLANRVDDYVTGGDPDAPHIFFVGYAYTTGKSGWQDYVTALGGKLRSGIEVLWTGNNTYAGTMSAADMIDPDRLLGRKVVIWDNRPVKITPLDGRSGDLPDGIGGFLTNPVVIELGYGFDGFWRVLGTAADYTWNPSAYDPTRSFRTWQPIAQRDGC